MKTTKYLLHLFLVFAIGLSLIVIGCAGTPSAEETAAAEQEESSVDQEKQAEGEPSGWTITISGMREDTVDESYFNDAKEHKSHYETRELEKKGTVHTYTGMPFWMIVAMADGNDSEHPYVFDKSLWETGYDVTLTAGDGYSATFNTADVAPDAIMVADSEDGNPIPPTIVGDVSGKLWVKELVRIDLDLKEAVASKPPFELVVDINDSVQRFTLEELEDSAYYIEAKGSYTTSAGTTHTHVYGGVRFADFIQQFMKLEKDNTVTMVAMDGYEMSYSGEQILDDSDGEWILAFKSDGEYMPMDPGYIRTIKVGPSVPNIEGHLSVRMIEKIVATGESFKDFTLAMKGKLNADLDRQTIQSGVSCHKTTVTYEDRKSGEQDEYTGIPLYLLCAYSDDPQHAPHKQDKSILSYKEEAALDGYQIKITASDGFSITLDSNQVHNNDDVIIAMYKNGEVLPDREWPLVIVWDVDAELVPDGIKPVRNITEIELLF